MAKKLTDRQTDGHTLYTVQLIEWLSSAINDDEHYGQYSVFDGRTMQCSYDENGEDAALRIDFRFTQLQSIDRQLQSIL